MFTVLSFDAVRGSFAEVSTHDDLHDAVLDLKERQTATAPHIVTWSNLQGKTGEEEDNLLKAVLAANEGRVLRVMKNALVQVERLEEARVCCGSGSNCYCVLHASGTKQCETHYCNASGYCWWVPCNVPCGC